MIKVIYIIPKDASSWKKTKTHALDVLEDIQWFFADQLDYFGYGPKTFEIATDENNALIFHQITSNLTKDDFVNSYWNNCKLTAQEHGLREPNNIEDITIYIFEAYSIIEGIVSNAGSRGWAKGTGGEVFISSLHFKLAKREWIIDDSEYGGMVFDWISTDPLKNNTLSWNGRGLKLGDVSGAAYGVIAHELGHAFGLNHDKTDNNRKGHIMGYGFRGMRGYFQPKLTNDFCIIKKEDAELLNNSNFFAARKLKHKSIIFSNKNIR